MSDTNKNIVHKTLSDKRSPEHRLFGELLKQLLMPHDILVKSNYPIMKGPPELDIVFSRESSEWTSDQLSMMPLCLKMNLGQHNIIELKYTQSVNEDAIVQLLAYRTGFKQVNNLNDTDDIRAFLLSSKTPSVETLTRFGYIETTLAGVYSSQYPIVNRAIIISINDLAETDQNMLLKLFASKNKIFIHAVKYFITKGFLELKESVVRVILKIISYRLSKDKGGALMKAAKETFSNEDDQVLYDFFINLADAINPKLKFLGMTPQDVTQHFDSKELAACLSPKDRLAGLAPKDRLEGLAPKDRLEGLAPKDRLEGLNIQELKMLKQIISKAGVS